MTQEPHIDELLGGYLDSALSPEQDRELAGLLRRNRTVRTQVKTFLALDDLLDQLMNEDRNSESLLAVLNDERKWKGARA